MCGIFLSIFRDESPRICTNQFKQIINNRGPNAYNQVEVVIGNSWKCQLQGSVLWTQGDQTRKQPVFNDSGSFLLWNGDVFYGLPDTGCDTDIVFAELIENGLSTFSKICGPYAFIYYDAVKNILWFGRDALGRHSLLWNVNSLSLLLTSVSSRTIEIEEVPNYGIFMIDLSKSVIEIQLHPWYHLPKEYINIKVPCLLCNDLYHSSFIPPSENSWYNKEPEPYELEFLSGLAENEAATIFQHLIENSPICNAVKMIKNLMIQSVRRRTETIPNYCSTCISSEANCNHSKFAILFSGGLDSTILALITNLIVPMNEAIDLFNVAFDRTSSKTYNFLVPDRKNGYKSLKELSNLAPNRKWNFIEINVNKEELEEIGSRHIADLIYPLSSILDDSLGCALWFAARGKGILDGQAYTSPARVVLLGMGADEIFGGYSRHRKIFEKDGWSALGLQLSEEVRNIAKRNLGRDNRVVTDHGRQPRLPFLDENFFHFVNSLPPWHRCCLKSNMPNGIGDKMLLRCLAWDLGLRYCSSLPKKALQFGSKIANPKEKGHELSKRLV